MKITIQNDGSGGDVQEIIIRCGKVDAKVNALITAMELYDRTIPAQMESKIYFIKPEQIFYFESVDSKTFLYTDKNAYEIKYKLYELEQHFAEGSFLRINKSQILNINHITYIIPAFDGKITAVLNNQEKVIISRQYSPAFRQKMKL